MFSLKYFTMYCLMPNFEALSAKSNPLQMGGGSVDKSQHKNKLSLWLSQSKDGSKYFLRFSVQLDTEGLVVLKSSMFVSKVAATPGWFGFLNILDFDEDGVKVMDGTYQSETKVGKCFIAETDPDEAAYVFTKRVKNPKTGKFDDVPEILIGNVLTMGVDDGSLIEVELEPSNSPSPKAPTLVGTARFITKGEFFSDITDDVEDIEEAEVTDDTTEVTDELLY